MSTLLSLPPEARDHLQGALQRGEVVRWAATADPVRSTEARPNAFLNSRYWLAGSTVFTLAAAVAAWHTRSRAVRRRHRGSVHRVEQPDRPANRPPRPASGGASGPCGHQPAG